MVDTNEYYTPYFDTNAFNRKALDRALCFILCVGGGFGEHTDDNGVVHNTRHLPLSRALPWNRPLPIEIVQEIMDNVFDNSRVDMFGLHHDLRCTYERNTETLKNTCTFRRVNLSYFLRAQPVSVN